MKVKSSSRPNYDQTDRQHLRQTTRTRGFQILEERMTETLEQERLQLEVMTGNDLLKQQGRVAMLRRVLQLPKILDDEMGRHGEGA